MSHSKQYTDEPQGYQTPRWVKISVILVVMLILFIGIMVFNNGGDGHGPGRHSNFEEVPSNSIEGHSSPLKHNGQ